jgi:hypothetical protein
MKIPEIKWKLVIKILSIIVAAVTMFFPIGWVLKIGFILKIIADIFGS